MFVFCELLTLAKRAPLFVCLAQLKQGVKLVLSKQIGMLLSVECPAEVIGVCYIYRLCNLICGILDGCAHAILSHSGATASQAAALYYLSIGRTAQNKGEDLIQ